MWQGQSLIGAASRMDQDGGWGRAYETGLDDPNTASGAHSDYVHVTFRR
ncbi:hypothetical protein [Streptomyces abyssomicinicus]|nr:hypothetical protein [Streptomyces abyssomicinicus]